MLSPRKATILVCTFLLFIVNDLAAQTTAVCGFTHKKVITIQGAQITGGPHTDFPILIDHTDGANLTTAAGKVTSASGFDIIFADDNANLLDFQLEEYNGATGRVVAWVKIPSLTNGTDVIIHMLYGKASIVTDQSSTNTWSNGYEAVYSLHNDFLDKTGNGFNATNSGSADDSPGKIADGQDLDGGTDVITTADIPNLMGAGNVSFSAWVNPDAFSNNDGLVTNESGGINGVGISLGGGGTGGANNDLVWYVANGSFTFGRTSTAPLAAGNWYHIYGTFDGSQATNATRASLYINGVAQALTFTGTIPATTHSNTNGIEIGRLGGGAASCMNGQFDHVELSTVTRSANWVATAYDAQNNPEGTFYTITAEVDNAYNSTGNGDWDATGTWGGVVVVPHVGADVTIDQNVDIDGGSGDYIVCNCDLTSTGATAVRMDMTTTRTLEVLEDIDMTLTGGGASTCAINLQGTTTLTIGGNVTMNRTNTSVDANLDIQLRDDCTFNLAGNLTATMGAGSGDDIYIDMEDNADLNITGNVSMTQADGDEMAFILDDQATADIGGNVTWDMSGGDDSRIQLNNNTGNTAEFNVVGNIAFTHTGGDDIVIRISDANGTSSQFTVGGNFTLDQDDGGDDFLIAMDGPTADLIVGGDMTLDLTSTDDDDVTIDLDDGDMSVTGTLTLIRSGSAHENYINLDGGDVIVGGLTTNNSGVDDVDHSIWISIDQASLFRVNGNVSMTQTGGNNTHIHVNGNNGTNGICDINGNVVINHGGGSDTELFSEGTNSDFDISGTVTVNQTGGDDVEFRSDGAASDLDIHGDVTVTHTAGDDTEFRVDGAAATLDLLSKLYINWNDGTDDVFEIDCNDGTITVADSIVGIRQNDAGPIEWDMDGGDFTGNGHVSLTSAGTLFGNQALFFDVDTGSVFTLNGNMDIVMTGGDDLRFDIDIDRQGDNSEVHINGNLTINRSGGDDIEFLVDNDNSIFHVTGNLDVTSSGGEEFYVNLDENGTFDIDGNFNYTHTEGLVCEIDLQDGTGTSFPVFNVDGDMNINMNGGGDDFDIDCNGGTFTVDGTATWTIGATAVGDEDIEAQVDRDVNMTLGNLTMSLNGGDNLSIDLGLNSTASTAQLNVTGNINMDHNGATGGDDMYINFHDNTRGTVGGNITLDNDAPADDLCYIRLNTTSELDVAGNINYIAVAAGRTEVEVNNTAFLRIAGNFVRTAIPGYGLLDCNQDATVEYKGSANTQIFAQSAGLGADNFVYQNVIVNNSFGTVPQLTMEGQADIFQDCDFQDGIISSTQTNILVFRDGATQSNAQDASHVNGWVRKIGDEAFIFPVGDDNRFREIRISAPAAATDVFEATYLWANPHPTYDNQTKVPAINHVSRLEYWLIEETGPGTPSVVLTLSWDPNSDVTGGSESELVVAHWQGGQWINEGNGGETVMGGSGIVPTAAAVGSFSPVTLASTTENNPLPVILVDLSVTNNDDHNTVSWTTLSESNSSHFEVERSFDGQTWQSIGEVDGVGFSENISHYGFDDYTIKKGLHYYRLKMVDLDGTFEYSSVVSISISGGDITYNVYPNPANDQLIVEVFEDDFEVYLTSILGVQLDVPSRNSVNGELLEVGSLSPGTYFVNIIAGNRREVVPITIRR